jgi:hypothetical protein
LEEKKEEENNLGYIRIHDNFIRLGLMVKAWHLPSKKDPTNQNLQLSEER